MASHLYTVDVVYLDGSPLHMQPAKGAYASREQAAEHLGIHTTLTDDEIAEVLDIVEDHGGPAITRLDQRVIRVTFMPFDVGPAL